MPKPTAGLLERAHSEKPEDWKGFRGLDSDPSGFVYDPEHGIRKNVDTLGLGSDVVGWKSVEPDDKELRLINSKFANRTLDRSEIMVRSGLVAHDQVDRDKQRFGPDLLKDFATTAPGKSVKWREPHVWRTPGDARIFAAGTVKADDGVRWVWVKFYYLRDGNEEATRNFDAGIWHAASIGFAASDMVGVFDKDGSKLYSELRGPGELLELSVVGVEAQQGAFVKNHNPENDPPGEGDGTPDDDSASKPKDDKGTKQGGTVMSKWKIGSKSFDLEVPDALEDSFASHVSDVNDNLDELADTKSRFGDMVKALEVPDGGSPLDRIAELKRFAGFGFEARKAKVTEVLKFATLLKVVDEKDADQERKHFDDLSDERLDVELARLKARFEKEHPKGKALLDPALSTDPQKDDNDDGEKWAKNVKKREQARKKGATGEIADED